MYDNIPLYLDMDRYLELMRVKRSNVKMLDEIIEFRNRLEKSKFLKD